MAKIEFGGVSYRVPAAIARIWAALVENRDNLQAARDYWQSAHRELAADNHRQWLATNKEMAARLSLESQVMALRAQIESLGNGTGGCTASSLRRQAEYHRSRALEASKGLADIADNKTRIQMERSVASIVRAASALDSAADSLFESAMVLGMDPARF